MSDYVAALERVVEAARELHAKYVNASTADEEGLLQITRPAEMRALWAGVDAAADMLDAALAELDGQTEGDVGRGTSKEARAGSTSPHTDRVAQQLPQCPGGETSSPSVCPCRVHGDPDGDCGENCG